jgi:uncharacterized protein (TIGR00255 family)
MKSMTGFGRGEATTGGLLVRVEVTSVNRKQTDIVVGLPRDLNELEARVREIVNAAVSRGRINVFTSCQPSGGGGTTVLSVNEALAAQYHEAIAKLNRQLGTEVALEAGDLLRAPGLFGLSEIAVTPEVVWPALEKALGKALAAMIRERAREGAQLRDDLVARGEALMREAAAITKLAPEVVRNYRAALGKRLADAGLPVDLSDERLVREIALYADRSDLSEELTRLGIHYRQFQKYVKSREPVGRAMDFLCQELNRELNTIGSKANNAAIAQHVVNAKSELEKIREQVQNVE